MKLTRFLAPLGAFLALASAHPAFAGINEWTYHGPLAGGGSVTALATHPTNGSIAMLATARGIYRSANGGTSWTLVKNDAWSVVRSIAFDPTNPNRIVASDGRVYLSEDGGLTFATAQGPTINTAVNLLAFAPNGTLYVSEWGGRVFRSPANLSTWTELAQPWPANSTPGFLTVDRVDSQVVYIGMSSGGMYRSANGGTSWSSIIGGFPQPLFRSYNHLATSPADAARLLVGTTDGIWLSTDTGATWNQQDTSYSSYVAFDPANSNRAYSAGFYSLNRSADGGVNWSEVQELRTEGVTGLALIPGATDGLLLASANGLARSDDAGATFVYRHSGLKGTVPRDIAASDDGSVFIADNSADRDLFERDGNGYRPLPRMFDTYASQRSMSHIAVAATDSDQIFAANSAHELMRSLDRGVSWSLPHPAFTPPNGGDYIGDIQIDPSNADVAYVGRLTTGIWKTTNAGTTFSFSRLMNSPELTTAVGVSPHNSQVLYAGGSDASTGVNTATGIYKSTDGGATWTEQFAPVATFDYSFLAFAFHPTNPNIVYAAGAMRLYRTLNGGASWQQVDFGAQFGGPFAYARAVMFDPLIPTTISVASPLMFGGFLRSVDGGATWDQIQMMNSSGQYTALTGAILDPNDSAVLLGTTNDSDIAEYRVAPDLSLDVSGIPASLPTTSTLSATFSVTNDGPHASSASEIVINFPFFITPSGTGCTLTGNTLRCRHGVLRVGQSHDFQVSLAVSSVIGSAQISATLVGHEADQDNSDNTAAINIVTTEVADRDISITSATQTINRGDSTQVTVTASNSGPSDATGISFSVQRSQHVSFSNLAPSAGTTCQVNNDDSLYCTVGTLAVNATATLTFTLTGESAGAGSVWAEVIGAGTDPDGVHSASRSFTVGPVTDMVVGVAETIDPATVDAGFQYIVSTANLGPDIDAFDVIISATTASITQATFNRGTCTIANNTATCHSNGVAPGTSGLVTLDLNSAVPGIATATATIVVANLDPDTTNNTTTIGTTLRLVGDLSVTVADSVDPATVGSPFTYAVNVRNDGPNSGGVQVVVPVTGATVTGAAMTGGICTNSPTSATCSGAFLPSGESGLMNVTVVASAPGSVTATPSATFNGFDPDTANNTATTETTARLVGDVSVTVAGSADPATVDGPFSYAVTVRNAGPNAGPVQVSVPVTGATVTGASASVGTCTNTTSSVTCNIPSLASNATAALTVNVTASTPGGSSATATASYFAGFDSNAANNSATATTTVRRVGDLGVTVTDSADPITTGASYSYTVTVNNTGPNAGAVNISVPVTGATVTGSTLNGGTCTNAAAAVTCDITSLASNASATLTINVNAGAAGSASAVATVTFAGTDPVATNNSATANTTVNAAPAPPGNPPNSGGGGGGGGRFDWLFAGLLGLLVMLRQWRLQARGAA